MSLIKKITTLLILTLIVTSCSTTPENRNTRNLASDPCAEKYFIDEYSHYDNNNECHGL